MKQDTVHGGVSVYLPTQRLIEQETCRPALVGVNIHDEDEDRRDKIMHMSISQM